MGRPSPLFFLIILIAPGLFPPNLYAQGHEAGVHSDVLRGEIWVELDPVYRMYIDEQYPLNFESASRRALEETAAFYSAMIYGWSFYYDIGERARRIPEEFKFTPVNQIPFGDPGLRVTEVQIKENRVWLWTDYKLTDEQKHRIQTWKQDSKFSMQGVGYGPVGNPVEINDWITIKLAALEDAARSSLRTRLRASERNRPKQVTGYISLASFPRFYFHESRWAASARFRVEITEIIPFAAY